jgi:hypothetical protein
MYNWNPLAQIGGLSNNEVAELVYAQIFAATEHEGNEGSQTGAADSEVRGVYGANFQSVDRLFAASNESLQITDEEVNDGQLDSVGSDQINDHRIFGIFNAYGALPHFDSATGHASNGANPTTTYERNFRELYGRGPVVDSADSMAIGCQVICAQSDIPVQGTIRAHFVWDVAEVSDAGREFSVPTDD